MFNDIISQLWTLLGLTVAWLVLEGTAKVIAGNLILVTLAVWVITYPLRHSKSREEEERRQVKLERKAAKKAEAKRVLKKAQRTAARLEQAAELSGLDNVHTAHSSSSSVSESPATVVPEVSSEASGSLSSREQPPISK